MQTCRYCERNDLDDRAVKCYHRGEWLRTARGEGAFDRDARTNPEDVRNDAAVVGGSRTPAARDSRAGSPVREPLTSASATAASQPKSTTSATKSAPRTLAIGTTVPLRCARIDGTEFNWSMKKAAA
jgi:hypothetical protein